MDLHTVNKESALAEAGNSVLTSSAFHRLPANFGFCRSWVHSWFIPGILRLQSKLRNLAFGRKQRTVIISAEFGDEQIHETGHRSFFLQTKLNPLPLNPHPPPPKKSCCILFRLVKVDVNDTGVTHQLRMELFSCLVTLLTMNKCIVHAFYAYLFNEK